jgi:hypothetical protein
VKKTEKKPKKHHTKIRLAYFITGFINFSRELAYFIAGGLLTACEHYISKRKLYTLTLVICNFIHQFGWDVEKSSHFMRFPRFVGSRRQWPLPLLGRWRSCFGQLPRHVGNMCFALREPFGLWIYTTFLLFSPQLLHAIRPCYCMFQSLAPWQKIRKWLTFA